MTHAYVLIMLLAVAAPVGAQVYKCQEGGKTVYSGTPCHAEAQALDVRPAAGEYSREDGIRAEIRTLRGQVELLNDDIERARARDLANAERKRKERAEAARCAELAQQKDDAEYWSKEFRHPDNVRREQEKAKKLATREFFDCKASH